MNSCDFSVPTPEELEHVNNELDVGLEEDFDPVIEIEDPETGETYSFYMADDFEYNGEYYCVLVDESEDADEYFIARIVQDEDGEVYVETLEEEEIDTIYEAYDEILEAYFEEDEEDEHEEEW